MAARDDHPPTDEDEPRDTPVGAATLSRRTGRFRIERGDVVRDRAEVIECLRRNLEPRVSPEHRFRRQYEAAPAGEPAFWVAREDSGHVVGLLSVFPVPVRVAGTPMRAGIQGDFAVDEAHRGPFGPAVPLVRAQSAWLAGSELAFAFGVPNELSGPVVSNLGSVVVGRVDGWVRPLRLELALDRVAPLPRPILRLARVANPVLRVICRDDRHRDASHRGYRLEELESFDHRFESLFHRASLRPSIVVERSVAYLNWKYDVDTRPAGDAYTILGVVDRSDDVVAYAVMERADWGLRVLDILHGGDPYELDLLLVFAIRVARRLGVGGIGLRYLGRDHLLIERLRSFGFVRRRDATLLMAQEGGAHPDGVDIFAPQAWSFVVGDTDL